jgi:hypothetical protein
MTLDLTHTGFTDGTFQMYMTVLYFLNDFDIFLNFTEKTCQMFENTWFVKYFVFEVFRSVSGKLQSSQM